MPETSPWQCPSCDETIAVTGRPHIVVKTREWIVSVAGAVVHRCPVREPIQFSDKLTFALPSGATRVRRSPADSALDAEFR